MISVYAEGITVEVIDKPAEPPTVDPVVLQTIGPATPEQISLFLPVPDTVPYTATATCEYKRAADSVWTEGHPLHRIRNDYSSGPFGDTLRHGFAWPILDLTPGTTYDIRVTMTDGAAVTTHTLSHTTRDLPGPARPFNKTASGDADIRAKVAGLVAGDVLQIADGVHNISTGHIVVSNRVGTPTSPIVIRGQSLTGTIIRRASNDIMFLLANLQNVIFENLTIECSGINNGGVSPPSQVANPTSTGFHVGGAAWSTTNLTIRNCRITGVDKGFYADNRMTGLLIYDNDFIGNNPWVPNSHGPGTMASWGDDGIHFPGEGNCVWQNLIKGFGDSIAYCSGFAQGQQTANASHAYRNDIRDSCDDSCEVDDAEACCTFYDNRITNGVNAISMDAICGGPFVMARNVFLNLFRVRPFKWNSPNSGHFHYNNTIYMPQHGSTDPADDSSNGGHWYLPGSDVDQRAKGYRNNVHVFTGSMARLMKMGPTVHTKTDWTHNSWYPDGAIEFSTAAVANLAEMKALKFNYGQVFAPPGTTLMQNDTITVANPWVTAITLPATSAGELVGEHIPVPAHASLRNTGVAIPNITDGFSGAAPDRGAIITGRPLVAYGNQTGAVVVSVPSWVPSTAWQWTAIPGTIWNTYTTGWPNQAGDPISDIYAVQWAYGGTTYSRTNHEMWIHGGGHNGTTINALSKWVLATNSPSVVLACPPTPVSIRASDYAAGSAIYDLTGYHTAGGGAAQRPKSPHAYSNNRYFDDVDEFVAFGLAAIDSPTTDIVQKFDVAGFPRAGTEWRAPGHWPNQDSTHIGAFGVEVQLVFESYDRTALYYGRKYEPLMRYTSAGVTTTIGTTIGDVYGALGAAQSATQALILGGIDVAVGWRARFVNLTTGIITNFTPSGEAFPDVGGFSTDPVGLQWVEAIGKYVVLLRKVNDSTGTYASLAVYTITPSGSSAATATLVTMTGKPPTTLVLGTCMHYDPDYGVLLIAASPSQPLFAIKVED